MIENLDQLIAKIEKASTICVTSHLNPDGDSIGSILGLGMGLRKKYPDKVVTIAVKDDVPPFLSFLSTEMIEKLEDGEGYDLFFVLDCGDALRAGVEIEKDKIVNLDHHVTNPLFGDINLVKKGASSTCELAFELLSALEIEIDQKMAECLYTGISTDTGSFKYVSTSPRTHVIAAELLSKGVNTEGIIASLYQSRSLSKTLLLKEAIDNLELLEGNRLALLEIRQEMLDNSGSSMSDVDFLVEFIRDIDGVAVSAVIKKLDKGAKVSLRSKEGADVAKIAQSFGGGGHLRAAGYSSLESMDTVRTQLLEAIREELS